MPVAETGCAERCGDGPADPVAGSWYDAGAFVTLAGLRFPDPYQALEEDSEGVLAWQDRQAARATAFADAFAQDEMLRARVARLGSSGVPSLPRPAGPHWFRIDDKSERVLRSTAPMRGEVLLFAPGREEASQPTIAWISPSPDGALLALGLCFDGSERNVIRLVDVATGCLLPDPPRLPLPDAVTGGAQWLGDGSGFYFTTVAEQAEAAQRILLHRLGASPATVEVDIPWPPGARQKAVIVSHDYRVALAYEGNHTPRPVAIADLERSPLDWKPFNVGGGPGRIVGHVVGDELIALTDVGAPRGRLVGIPLTGDAAGDPARWRTLVPESEAVLRTVTPVGGLLYLIELVDTDASIRLVDLDGRPVERIPLPESSAVEEPGWAITPVATARATAQFLFASSSLRSSWAMLEHRPGAGAPTILRPAAVSFPRIVIENGVAVSADGTKVPYSRMRRSDLPDGPLPTLIYAYGGFNQPLLPAFPGAKLAFVEAGGALVHAHVRGGGEYGLDWWNAGRHRNKQNSYDDLYAVAECLRGRGQVSRLAVIGRSNGGLLGGVAITQRPELWEAAILEVPRLDLIGACLTDYGRAATLRDRSVDPDCPDEARRLASYSPYHCVEPGKPYPAVLIVAGANDLRCPAGDARKFAARLQDGSTSGSPILLHVWPGAGHGVANAADLAAGQEREWLAFLFRRFDMALPAESLLDAHPERGD